MVASCYYDRLGIGRGASPQDIAAAYRALCRRHHPDLNGGREDALRMMQALNEAYAVLRDPARRRSYDRSRAGNMIAVRRRRPRRAAPVRPNRPSVGTWVQAAMFAISIVLTVAPQSASAGASTGVARPVRP